MMDNSRIDNRNYFNGRFVYRHSGTVSVVFDNSKLKRIALDYILSHPEECQKDDPEFDEWCDRVISAQEKAKEGI